MKFIDYAGKRVIAKHNKTGEEFCGVALEQVDWLVGCPVIKMDDGRLVAVGYECYVVRIEGEK